MPGLAGYRGELLVIANPISGHGAVGRHLSNVEGRLRDLGLKPRVFRTQGPGDARREASKFEEGVILSFGGDGTFNEVLNGADLDRCILGVIPAGTGNVLAKELGIPGNHRRAVETLASSRIAPYDLGVCNGQRFACVCGAGMDAQIVHMVHEKRERHLTQLHYVPVLVWCSMEPTPWDVRVEVDGECVADGANIVCVGNSRSYGGPIEIASAASPMDGKLDVMAARVGGPCGMCAPGVAAMLRGMHASQAVRYARGESVRLTSPHEKTPWEIDGDFGGYLPVNIDVDPQRIRMLVPQSFRPRAKGFRGQQSSPTGQTQCIR